MSIWDYDWDDWVEPAYPMVGPAFDWSTVEYITIHHPGSPRVLTLTFEAERAEIRAEQRNYTDDPNRGYSLGYNAKVFQDGTRWMLRGDVLKCAANGTAATNRRGFAIQIRIANGEAPTQKLIASVRELVAWCRARAGRYLSINGHRDIRATACPGDLAYALIRAGAFEPVEALVVPPVYPPVSEEDLMKTVITRWGDEPYLIEVGDLYPGSTQRPWRGIPDVEAERLIAVGLAEDRRAVGLPMTLKGVGPDAPAPQYRRIG